MDSSKSLYGRLLCCAVAMHPIIANFWQSLCVRRLWHASTELEPVTYNFDVPFDILIYHFDALLQLGLRTRQLMRSAYLSTLQVSCLLPVYVYHELTCAAADVKYTLSLCENSHAHMMPLKAGCHWSTP